MKFRLVPVNALTQTFGNGVPTLQLYTTPDMLEVVSVQATKNYVGERLDWEYPILELVDGTTLPPLV